MVLIQLKDICYYDDDFEYEPFLVDETEDKDFEKKYNKLVKICKSYECFDEVEDYINANFKRVDVEKRIIEV